MKCFDNENEKDRESLNNNRKQKKNVRKWDTSRDWVVWCVIHNNNVYRTLDYNNNQQRWWWSRRMMMVNKMNAVSASIWDEEGGGRGKKVFGRLGNELKRIWFLAVCGWKAPTLFMAIVYLNQCRCIHTIDNEGVNWLYFISQYYNVCVFVLIFVIQILFYIYICIRWGWTILDFFYFAFFLLWTHCFFSLCFILVTSLRSNIYNYI